MTVLVLLFRVWNFEGIEEEKNTSDETMGIEDLVLVVSIGIEHI